tara:strand:+ start:13 stop:1863 length:1851 start_codon:yes stop_codon:yes gene_type:complete
MGGSAPKAPDYAEQARVQGESNVEAARTASKLSNPNMITPYGSQTVTYGDTAFDQAGYDSAMAGYQQRSLAAPKAPNRADFNQDYTTDSFDQSGYDNAQNSYNSEIRAWEQKPDYKMIRGDRYPFDKGAAPTAPNKDAFSSSTQNTGFDATGYNTALNRYNSGQPELAPDRANFMGATGGGDQDIPTVRQTLSPASQSLYDQELRINAGVGNTAERGLATIDQMLGTPFDMGNVRGKPQYDNAQVQARTQYDPTQLRDKEQFDEAGMRGRAEFDPSQLRNKAQFDDSNIRDQAQSGQQAWNNAYNAQMQRNQPFEDRRRDRLTNQLSNQGIFAGSEAFGESMRDLERGENDFRLGAQQNATAQQQAQFAMDMQGRQQDQQEAQQAYSRGTQGRGLDFQEQQNLYGMGIQNRQLDQQEAQQQYARNVQGRAQDLGEQQAGFGMGLQGRSQDFGEQQALFGMDTQGRQDDITQQAYLRQLPLNELNALRMGNQIQNPQFQGFQGQSVAPAPMMQAANAQYNAALDATNAKNAASGNMMSGLMGIGAAGLGGFMMSDARLKENIVPIAQTPGGNKVYSYNFLWDKTPQIGVMAHEVEHIEGAVKVHPSGYKMVDYSKVI